MFTNIICGEGKKYVVLKMFYQYCIKTSEATGLLFLVYTIFPRAVRVSRGNFKYRSSEIIPFLFQIILFNVSRNSAMSIDNIV